MPVAGFQHITADAMETALASPNVLGERVLQGSSGRSSQSNRSGTAASDQDILRR